MLLAMSNLADVGIAAFGSLSAIATVLISTRGQNKKLDKVERSVATSNGKTSGQYIEELFHKVDGLKVGQDEMVRQFAQHTIQDATNFARLSARLEHIEKEQA